MIDEARARELGMTAFGDREVVLEPARELEQGWHFPVIEKGTQIFVGVIVGKETGRALRLMIGSDIDDEPALYDRGYQFESYDLVILSIRDLEEAVRALLTFGFGAPHTYYRYGKVWRLGRVKFTDAELRQRLSALPCIFTGGWLEQRVAELEKARDTGSFEFTLFEYRGPEDEC